MLRRLRDFEHWDIFSSEGVDVGKVHDCYFDDELWTVRYFAVKTGGWLMQRSVLLSPMAVERENWKDARLDMSLTREQIKGAPDVDLARPISREWEARYSGYYAFPYYWAGPALWGAWKTPAAARDSAEATRPAAPAAVDDLHLRSAHEVTGYRLHAQDGEIGHVEDFLIDDHTWTIRYLMIDTSNWIGGRSVLVAPQWTDRVDWPQRQVRMAITRDEVKASPEYHPGMDIDPEYEERLSSVYKRVVRHV